MLAVWRRRGHIRIESVGELCFEQSRMCHGNNGNRFVKAEVKNLLQIVFSPLYLEAFRLLYRVFGTVIVGLCRYRGEGIENGDHRNVVTFQQAQN